MACLMLGSALMVIGCRPKPAAKDADIALSIHFDPDPPAAGSSAMTISLADAGGAPVRLGVLDVEANMNHAGMRPVFAHLKEIAPGHYEGPIEFTMGGDWFLLVSGKFSSGRHLDKKVDVPGVRSK